MTMPELAQWTCYLWKESEPLCIQIVHKNAEMENLRLKHIPFVKSNNTACLLAERARARVSSKKKKK